MSFVEPLHRSENTDIVSNGDQENLIRVIISADNKITLNNQWN